MTRFELDILEIRFIRVIRGQNNPSLLTSSFVRQSMRHMSLARSKRIALCPVVVLIVLLAFTDRAPSASARERVEPAFATSPMTRFCEVESRHSPSVSQRKRRRLLVRLYNGTRIEARVAGRLATRSANAGQHRCAKGRPLFSMGDGTAPVWIS